MPEAASPGVYVEDGNAGSRPIEGVPTGIPGIVGLAAFGPVGVDGMAPAPRPACLASYLEFERAYGGLGALRFADGSTRPALLAQSVRAFFENGGQRLYVARIHRPAVGADHMPDHGVAGAALFPARPGKRAHWRARWPGSLGNAVLEARFLRGPDLAFTDPWRGVQAVDARPGMLVEVTARDAILPLDGEPIGRGSLAVVRILAGGEQSFRSGSRRLRPATGARIRELRCALAIGWPDGRRTELPPLPLDEAAAGSLVERFAANGDLCAETGLCLELPPRRSRYRAGALDFALELQRRAPLALTGGHDGLPPRAADFAGVESGGGLAALETVDDVDLLLAPDGAAADADGTALAVACLLRDAAAAPRPRPRFAILDPPPGLDPQAVLQFSAPLRSGHAALYWPWLQVFAADVPDALETVPPSGAMAGIYARVDRERGVHKAPANEILRGIAGFEQSIGEEQQTVLNLQGICVLRFVTGKGHLVWGARTLGEDPEWRYVPVRRLADYLQASCVRGLQWVVFEPNGEPLWTQVRSSVEEFLLAQWRNGALIGARPEQAFFVRCDRSTMSMADLDAGRLVLEFGFAPVRPAEFVVLRIGFATAGTP
jgi:phage tail sheath protein FI